MIGIPRTLISNGQHFNYLHLTLSLNVIGISPSRSNSSYVQFFLNDIKNKY